MAVEVSFTTFEVVTAEGCHDCAEGGANIF